MSTASKISITQDKMLLLLLVGIDKPMKGHIKHMLSLLLADMLLV